MAGAFPDKKRHTHGHDGFVHGQRPHGRAHRLLRDRLQRQDGENQAAKAARQNSWTAGKSRARQPKCPQKFCKQATNTLKKENTATTESWQNFGSTNSETDTCSGRKHERNMQERSVRRRSYNSGSSSLLQRHRITILGQIQADLRD